MSNKPNISKYPNVYIPQFLAPDADKKELSLIYKINNLIKSTGLDYNHWIDFPHELIDIDDNNYNMSMKCLLIPFII